MLTTVTQYEQGQEVIRMAVRLFTALAQRRDLDSMMELLPEVYPWVRFLPGDDRVEQPFRLIDIEIVGDVEHVYDECAVDRCRLYAKVQETEGNRVRVRDPGRGEGGYRRADGRVAE